MCSIPSYSKIYRRGRLLHDVNTICCNMAVVLAFKTMVRVGNIRTDRAAKVGSFNYILQSRAIESKIICFVGSTCLFRKILIRRACIIFLALKSSRNCSFVKNKSSASILYDGLWLVIDVSQMKQNKNIFKCNLREVVTGCLTKLQEANLQTAVF